MHQLLLPRVTMIWRWSMTQMDIPSYQIGQRSVLTLTLLYIPEAVFCVLLQVVDPLPPVDHSEVSPLNSTYSHWERSTLSWSHQTTNHVILSYQQIEYPGFTRNFYTEHEEISKLPPAEVHALRAKMGLKVTGFQAPKPCVSFAHFNFDDNVMSLIRKSEYSQPTGIQSQVSH